MSSTAKKARRARGALTREQILAAALELVDAGGLEALTMRNLAEALRCGTMTLYSHVAGRDDLVAGIVGLVITTLDLRYVPGETWQDCARRTVASYRALAHDHPAAFELLAFADNDVEPVAPYFERLLWLFTKGGLSDEAARTFLSVADGFSSGFLLYESRSLLRQGTDPEPFDEQGRETASFAALHAKEAFDAGFEVVIRGIEALFPESTAQPVGSATGSADGDAAR
jgi:AcrR family transcriptional regulator